MNIVRKTFLLFLCAFLLQVSVLAALLYMGYSHSEGKWKEMMRSSIEQTSTDILLTSSPWMLPQDIPLAVYNAEGTLIAANRGTGRGSQLQDAPLIPIIHGSNHIGYYSTGRLSYRQDAANHQLIQTLTTMLGVGVLLSLAISMGAAYYFSRHVSRPALQTAAVLKRISKGEREMNTEVSGTEEIKQIARSAGMLQQQLRQEKDLRSQWAQDLAHDLRTPVSSLKAQLEAIRDGVLQAEQHRISQILQELKRMEMLVHDLEELMHLESPEMSLSWSSINTKTLTQECSYLLETTSDPKVFAAELFVDSFYADERLIYRALSNLLVNAQRHTPAEGRITLSIWGENSYVCLSVHNTGEPIPKSELTHIFNRLYRGEYARTTPGTGLGLPIVQQIVSLHAGTINVSSSLEKGTTFTLRIPQTKTFI